MPACEGRGYSVSSSNEERNVVECDGVTVTPSLAHIMNRNKIQMVIDPSAQRNPRRREDQRTAPKEEIESTGTQYAPESWTWKSII